jgi:hypothetical protein
MRPEQDRFAAIAHSSMGLGLGLVRGLTDLAGLRGPAAGGAFFAVAWAPDLVVVPAAGAAQPPWRWGFGQTAISSLHHAVCAAAGVTVHGALSRR